MVTCKAARRPGPDRGRRQWAGAVPSPAPLRACLSLFPPLRDWRAELGWPAWLSGGRREPGRALPLTRQPGPLPPLPKSRQVSHEKGEDVPRAPPPGWRGASLGGLVPWALVTSLHRPVCPTSQEPESPLAGEPVAVRGLCVSHLRSPPRARGLSGLAERHRGRETRRILRHPVCPLSRRLLGAGTQEEPPPPCLRILGFGGSA